MTSDFLAGLLVGAAITYLLMHKPRREPAVNLNLKATPPKEQA